MKTTKADMTFQQKWKNGCGKVILKSTLVSCWEHLMWLWWAEGWVKNRYFHTWLSCKLASYRMITGTQGWCNTNQTCTDSAESICSQIDFSQYKQTRFCRYEYHHQIYRPGLVNRILAQEIALAFLPTEMLNSIGLLQVLIHCFTLKHGNACVWVLWSNSINSGTQTMYDKDWTGFPSYVVITMIDKSIRTYPTSIRLSNCIWGITKLFKQ